MGISARHYFQISISSGVPIYRQIIDQVKTHIATGRLKADVFLPSVRMVAKELEVNPMTVSKAYSTLEKEGVVEAVRGRGMRVRSTSKSIQDLKDRSVEMHPVIKEVVLKAKQLSLDCDQVNSIIKDIWEDMKDE